ncbi:MAG: hypothetical protein GX447_08620 [Elusimicrobia bacterium]|nr:hypothetical protein [Elusimicrobiota bacterium]
MSVNNNDNKKAKLRIKLPPGAEFEAEGSEDFVLNQKEAFLQAIREPFSQANNTENQNAGLSIIPQETALNEAKSIWQAVVSFDKDIPYIIKKTSSLKPYEAALILMAAQRAVKNIEELSAINLSKGLKLSGLKAERIDRELSSLIKENKISAFGFKRSRSYKINQKGIQDAYLKALEIIKN